MHRLTIAGARHHSGRGALQGMAARSSARTSGFPHYFAGEMTGTGPRKCRTRVDSKDGKDWDYAS